jgi:glycosyltransferase involved in cell wall biosynthesis
MEYGLIIYNETRNLGDDIQTYATKKYLPHVDYIIDREHMNEFRTKDGKQAAVIFSGWYLYEHYSWPPSPYIKPLLLSMHFDTYFSLKGGKRLTENDVLDGYGAEWLKLYGPAGVRDENTLTLLQNKNIPSYLSGCITLTIEPFPDVEYHGKIITVDVSDRINDKIMQSTDKKVEQVSHSIAMSAYDPDSRFDLVEQYLKLYQGASLVVTRRLHAALPALAMGTPVLFIDEAWSKNRTSTYSKMLNSCTEEELLSGAFLYDFNNPTANPDIYMAMKKNIKKRCEAFVEACEKSMEEAVDEKIIFDDMLKRTHRLSKLLSPHNPKISIIVPVYNMEKYLDECIESLLAQDLDEYEIIMVNDGSIDKSQFIIDGYCSRYPDKCYSVIQVNNGLGAARNIGLHMAKGKYIMFVDADDWLEENVLGSLYRFVEYYGCDLAVFDEYLTEGKNASRIIFSGHIHPGPVINKREAIEYSTDPAHVCKRIYHRDLITEREFLSIWFEDIAFTPVVTSYADKICYFKVPVYNYRQRNESITGQNENQRNLEVIKAWTYALKNANSRYIKEVFHAIIKSADVFTTYRPLFKSAYEEFKKSLLQKKAEIEFSSNPEKDRVPKVINYSWFGAKGKSDQLISNIKKWHEKMPDFELICWNEEKWNVFEQPYTQQAYTKKHWKELSEYVRIKILYEKGGFFLENCVSSVSMPSILSENQLLIGINPDGALNTSVLGSEKKNPILKSILDYYETQNLISLHGEIKDISLLRLLQNRYEENKAGFLKVIFEK